MNWTIPKAVAAGLVLFSLSGCITMETLGKAKDEFSDGNIGSGLFYTLISPLMIVPDVFTLGGTTDPSVVAGTAMGAAATYSASKSTSSCTSARTVATPTPTLTPTLVASSTMPGSTTAMSASSPQYAAGGALNSSTTNSKTTSTGSGTKVSNTGGSSNNPTNGTTANNPPAKHKVNVPGRSQCIRTADTSRSQDVQTLWFYSLENTCGETLNAHWCESAACTRADEAWEIPAGGKRDAELTAASRESARVRVWACPLRYNGQEVNFDSSTGQCWAWSS